MSKVLRVEFTDTLMAWYDEGHVPSGDRQSFFYFRVPDSWVAEGDTDLQKRIYSVAQAMYNDLNDYFHQQEPSDLAYMAVLNTHGVAITPEEESQKPWLDAKVPAVWEWTPCVVVADDGTYTKVAPTEF